MAGLAHEKLLQTCLERGPDTSSRLSWQDGSTTLRLRYDTVGSAGQSPGASVQGIIARGDDPGVAILVECGVALVDFYAVGGHIVIFLGL